MKNFLSLFLIFGICTVFVNSSYSSSVGLDDGTVVAVDKIYTYTTTGNTMSGMSITVNSSIGDTTANWIDNQGAVYKDPSTGDTLWSLSMDNYDITTFNNGDASIQLLKGALWTFDVTDKALFDVKTINIDAMAGGTVFDIISNDFETTGSAYGGIMEWIAEPSGGFAATYSNAVRLTTASTPLYDLYGSLSIDFTTNNSFFTSSDTLSFYADTDNFRPIPEPATILLFGLGLVGLTVIRRKKN